MDRLNNNIDSIGKIKNKESAKEKSAGQSEFKAKTGDLSAQTEYLGTMNKAKLNADNIKKNNSRSGSRELISFKGSGNSEFKIPSESEFENLRQEVYEKIKRNPDFQKCFGDLNLSYGNIQAVNKIISTEKLYNNPIFMKQAHDIAFFTTRDNAELTDRILSLLSQPFSELLLDDGIVEDSKFYNDINYNRPWSRLIEKTKTPEQAKARVDVIDKILSDECFYNNPGFMNQIYNIIYSAVPGKTETMDILNGISSSEYFYNNSEFMKYAEYLLTIDYAFEKSEACAVLMNKILSDERLFNNPYFMAYAGEIIHSDNNVEKALAKCEFIDEVFSDESVSLLPNQEAIVFADKIDGITYKDIDKLNKTIGKEKASRLSDEDTLIAAEFLPFCKKQNLNEIPSLEKRNLLRNLVACNADLFKESENLRELFPMLPKNQEEYCALLPAIVRSIGIETNTLSDEEVESFNVSLNNLGDTLKNISDEEFNNLDIKQEYSKDEFISDTLEKVKDLSPEERQKVYDYFGFELHRNKKNKTGFSISGYPVNLNNGKKLAQITNPETKAVVEDLRQTVIGFSENNPITCNNKEIETYLNEIITSLPELRPMIGRTQSQSHDYDVMQHSLKVMKEIVRNPEYEQLNESDKKIMLLSSLLHDITKREGLTDKTHEDEGSFDSFFIAKKFNLTKEEEIKLHTLIKNHEWLGRVNRSKNEEELIKNICSTAYDLRHDNIFDMSLIFTHADLKGVRKDNSFHDTKEGKSRIDFNGEVRSFGESADYYAGMIRDCIKELQKSQPVLPVTKLPSSDEIKKRITNVNEDGTTNIKGVYEDKDGLVIIKYNEVENWEEIGLPKGSISRGIETVTNNGKYVNTGNIKFIAHGLDYPGQLAKFNAFSLIDNDALLSVSYMERPESKYRLFRAQGVLLDVDTKYIHGGGQTDSGSGKEKNIQNFKDNYIFGAVREKDRLFISNLIKEATGMSDEDYVEFVRENSNKSFSEIEPVELREKLIKAFALINSNTRTGEREYNEMYISNPKPMGVFAYNMFVNEKTGNPVQFLNQYLEAKRTKFLREYALENNIPMVFFGD